MKKILVLCYFNIYSNIEIREAEKNDLPIILDLIDQLGYQTTLETLTQKLNSFKNSKFDKIWIATFENKVVGVLSLIILDPLYKKQYVAKIDAIIIDKNYHGMGIGKKLITKTELYAQQIGCQEVILSSNYKRTEAHKFYKHLGYKIYEAYNFEKNLD